MAMRDLFRSLLTIPIIILFWQATLYHQPEIRTDVTGALRLCYEIFGVASELGVRPPEVIVSVCTRQLPSHFDMGHAKAVSSVVTMSRFVEHHREVAERRGMVAFLTRMSLRELAVLVDATNWVRLLPSLVLVNPQMRGGLLGVLLTAAVASVPCRATELAPGFFVIAAIAAVDLALQISEARVVTSSVHASRRWRRPLREILREQAGYLLLQVLAPLVAALVLVVMLLGLGVIVDANADWLFEQGGRGAGSGFAHAA